ncbi:MAG: hypothetical protein HGA22_00015 [Clostridiales bacterium]|nr:hypothetical protein [Clostridiales bacterium]
MGTIQDAIKAAARRPSVIITPLVIMLVVSAMNIYIPVLPLVAGLGGMTGGSISEGMVSAIQMITSLDILPIIILIFVAFCLIGSLFGGLVFPWYFNTVDEAVRDKEKEEGYGVITAKYFLPYFFITLRSLAFLVFYLVFLMIACIPAIIVARAVSLNGAGSVFPSLLLDFVTAAVLFFSAMFSRAYIIYWYPSELKHLNKPFTAGKHLADAHFWSISARLLVFDTAFLLYVYLTLTAKASLMKFLIGWIPGALFVALFVVFVFRTYNTYLSEVLPEK